MLAPSPSLLSHPGNTPGDTPATKQSTNEASCTVFVSSNIADVHLHIVQAESEWPNFYENFKATALLNLRRTSLLTAVLVCVSLEVTTTQCRLK
jgi:hypothetical protein